MTDQDIGTRLGKIATEAATTLPLRQMTEDQLLEFRAKLYFLNELVSTEIDERGGPTISEDSPIGILNWPH